MVKKCFETRIDNVIPLIVFTSLRMEAWADNHVFKQFGLTSASFRIMALIDRLGPSSPSRMIELLGSSKSNLTQRLGFMLRAGLVKKNKEGEDGRRVVVALTSSGKQKYRSAFRIAKQYNDRLQSLFNDKELEAYFAFMEKLNFNFWENRIFSR